MRYPATEKLEIIRLVEQSHLSARRTLQKLNNSRTNFYEGFNFGDDGQMQLHVPQHADETDETTTRNSAAAAAVKQAEAVAALIEGLKHEQSSLGLTSVEQAKLNALRQAGADATPEQRAQIESLIDATHAQRDAIEASAEAMQTFENASNRALNTLIDGFLGSKPNQLIE